MKFGTGVYCTNVKFETENQAYTIFGSISNKCRVARIVQSKTTGLNRMKFVTLIHDSKLKYGDKNLSVCKCQYVICMQSGEKLKKIKSIYPNQIRFGTRIYNTKLQNGSKNKDIYAGW